ncbi:hypothetical protein A2U01_0117326, partial [Trifolium medium]|nr:hypothetical protein [Trifolium medium]
MEAVLEKWKGTGEVALGEAMGLDEAVTVATHLQLKKVNFELDAQVIVKAVKARRIP